MKASKRKFQSDDVSVDYKSFKEGCKFHEVEIVPEKDEKGNIKATEGKTGKGRPYKAYVLYVTPTGQNAIVKAVNKDHDIKLTFWHMLDDNSILLLFRQTAIGHANRTYLDVWKRTTLMTHTDDAKRFPSMPIVTNIWGRELDRIKEESLKPGSKISISETMVPGGVMNDFDRFALTDLFAQLLIDNKILDGEQYDKDVAARKKAAQDKKNAQPKNLNIDDNKDNDKPEQTKETPPLGKEEDNETENVEIDNLDKDVQL